MFIFNFCVGNINLISVILCVYFFITQSISNLRNSYFTFAQTYTKIYQLMFYHLFLYNRFQYIYGCRQKLTYI